MSLLLFIIGVAVYYYLYVAYFSKSNRDSEKTKSDEEDLTDIDGVGGGNRFCSIFKSFILSVADPANNNYIDAASGKPNPFLFRSFVDRFKSFEDVVHAMKEAGLGRCRLILGIDFTASNEWQGRSTHKGHSLHHLSSMRLSQNPYQHVMSVLEHTLSDFVDMCEDNDHDHKNIIDQNIKKVHMGIPAFGFGDSITRDLATFPLREDGLPCSSFQELLQCYRDCAASRVLSGPTSYAPIIHKAIEIVEQSNQYHILVIVADGQFVNKGPTTQAIVAASHYPLSIVVVGVGDGPWDTLHQFDDWLPQRQFDNFQFVEYESIVKQASSKNFEALLALHMLMEIPDQYKMVHKLGYISPSSTNKKLQKL